MIVDLSPDGLLNLSAELLLNDIVLLLHALDPHQTLLVEFIEACLFAEQSLL